MSNQPTPLTDAVAGSIEWEAGDYSGYVQMLLHAQKLESKLADAKAALAACREDSAELLAERSWWKDEVRAGYQRRYYETAENIVVADSILSPP